MCVYRAVWLTVACTLAVAGIGLTFLALPVTAVVDAVVAGTLVGAVGGGATHHWLARRPAHHGRQVVVGTRLGVRVVALSAVAGAALGLVLAGSIGLLGPTAFGMDAIACAALAASSPPAIRWYATGRPAPMPPSDAEAAPATPGTDTLPAPEPRRAGAVLRSLSYTELCRAWCESYELECPRDPAARARVAATRRAYLDELERRDPAAFARWLADVARAKVNPAATAPTPSTRTSRRRGGGRQP